MSKPNCPRPADCSSHELLCNTSSHFLHGPAGQGRLLGPGPPALQLPCSGVYRAAPGLRSPWSGLFVAFSLGFLDLTCFPVLEEYLNVGVWWAGPLPSSLLPSHRIVTVGGDMPSVLPCLPLWTHFQRSPGGWGPARRPGFTPWHDSAVGRLTGQWASVGPPEGRAVFPSVPPGPTWRAGRTLNCE